ncbi:trigger factor [Anaerotalea alkaliphila]|uniref:Trigger factor n=1 Tax=Anaerotalea alkaliphila TaxID=2662126 RepID=A0A7X5HTQ2_9FIRM|nr:trigger factor [Anaerotalea alkaliphila]NDL66487.1 trigger factor [Anaerotalea alkaliphila]
MNNKVETLENSMVKITVEVEAERFEKGLQDAYNKNKGQISIQGFRKGKAPRQIIERTYGAAVFYEDAANSIIPEAYDKAVEELGLEVVSRPEIDVVQMEKGKEFIFTAEVAVKPEITLGDYKGVEVEKVPVEVSDADVEAELDRIREQNSRLVEITDRPVQDKDQVKIDFEGFVDGVAFEGGKGEDYELTIGSHTFIDTFEDQLIGKSIGEEVEVNVTFPEAYQQESLQGKPALFKVTVKSIKVKEMPEADDELAKDVSEFETLAEYKEDLKANILKRKEAAARNAKKEAVMTKVIENADIQLPAPMVTLEAENMVYDMAQRLQYQGLSMDQYFQYTGQTMESMKESMKDDAARKIKGRLVLEAIAKAENLEITEEAMDEELKNMAAMYNMELDKLMENIHEEEKESLKADLLSQKALDLIADASVEV